MTIYDFSPQLRPDRAVVRLAGEGALAFLHNLLTMDLSVAQPAYGALLSPQGKILHDVFVVPDGDMIWIDVAKDQASEFAKKLMMYRLRAKLDIAIDAAKAVAVAHDNVLSGVAYADPRLAALGFRAIVDADTLAPGHGYDTARIAHGIADSVEDIGSGDMFVHEANLDQLHGVSFAKGCYVGQEVVSRTHHRNMARNRVLPVQLSGPVSRDTDISSGETRVGSMLSSHGTSGLALLRLDRLAEARLPLLANGQQLRVRKPSWASYEVTIAEAAQ